MQVLDLNAVIARVRQLPSLPALVMELIESFQSDDIDTATLARKIARDQALVAKVLRIANSSFYGLQGKVASLQDAVVVLGFATVRTQVIAAAVTGSFPASAAAWFDRRAFWLHGILVAYCARELAGGAGLDRERAFTAGMLHDIGCAVLVTYFPEHYHKVFEYRRQHDCYLIEAERQVLGLDHAEVGRALAERWKFAPVIQAAVADHHAPHDDTVLSLAGLVHVADVAAHALDLAGQEDELVPRLNAVTWARLGIGWPEFKRRLCNVELQTQGMAEVLAA